MTVEVRWQTKTFDAAVIHVRSAGKMDVVYAIDGSVGIFLTAEEHGLKLLGDEGKKEGVGKKKKECSVDGCSNKAHARDFCATHSKKPCSVDGCSTKAIARGLCDNHGGRGRKKVCSMDGCSSPVRARGLCSRHDEMKSCSVDGCSTKTLARGLCGKHGA